MRLIDAYDYRKLNDAARLIARHCRRQKRNHVEKTGQPHSFCCSGCPLYNDFEHHCSISFQYWDIRRDDWKNYPRGS